MRKDDELQCVFTFPLGTVSLARASVNGVAMAFTKKYQKKLTKVTKLTDIVTSVLALFETSVSKKLKDCKVNERQLNMLQELYHESFNNLSNVDLTIEAESTNQFEKNFTGRNQ